MGTFLPLAVGLSVQCGMDFGLILLFSGLMNLFSGLYFGIPVPVQPMKVIAAVAIAEGLSPLEIAASGIMVGAIVLLVGATGLARRIGGIFPHAIVRGIQLAIGLKLFWAGLQFINNSGYRVGLDSAITAVAAITLILLSFKYRNIPAALAIFAAGIFMAFYSNQINLSTMSLGSTLPGFLSFSLNDFSIGLFAGTIPQLPLTLLNSVVAVCALSGDLFQGRKLSENRISLSVGIMNLIACPLGGMPMCHGAGGLAAQYRFGARTGGSIVFLGIAKIALALLFGSSLLNLMIAFPSSILGAMLLFAGWQMAVVCRDIKGLRSAAIFATTAIMSLTIGLVWGVASGFAIYRLVRPSPDTGKFYPASAEKQEAEKCLMETT